jgi:hypothetical protein
VKKRFKVTREKDKRTLFERKTVRNYRSALCCWFKKPPLHSRALMFSEGSITRAGLVPDAELKG